MSALTPEQSVGHYENFPVGSVLLPARFRPAVAAVYRFARHADDLADEGDASDSERIAALDACSAELARIGRGEMPPDRLFADLVPFVAGHGIPLQLFEDLLSAFRQDVVKKRYEDFDTLKDYCRRSADPVGRILLHIFGEATPENLRQSDCICTALQLINFWQDVAIDWQKGRVYIPQEDLKRFGVNESQLAEGRLDRALRDLLAFEVMRARAMLYEGKPLGRRLPGRIGLEIRTIVAAADRLLQRIEAVDYDVFRKRPKLKGGDWPRILWRAL
ncbi:squalene synthase HpnC [Formivibrio citricus]|uniref:Squalene synthase HpnC n=1 Tax=Formivibrio citricus TaxID=83765 RepID=A0A1I4WWN9_9NEIS|nr:squalene synthase HpnC [Formivibrio citricus]SFN17613.1 squalene synthase HpnC [Formivibrio citricus]